VTASVYPKSITGSITIPEDASLNIPEIEMSYGIVTNQNSERKVDFVAVRFPSRYDAKTSRLGFDNDKIWADFNPEKELYSMTFHSVLSMIDPETGESTDGSEIEDFAAKNSDIEIIIFIQIALQLWGRLIDSFPLLDIFGNLALATLEIGEDIADAQEGSNPEPPIKEE